MKKPGLSGGFTLVELLTVIAIIAILASLVLATVHRVRRSVQGTVCKNDLRQMGIWLQLFINQRNEYPLMINNEVPQRYPDHAHSWSGALRRVGGFPDVIYRGDAGDVFVCPAAKEPPDLGRNEGWSSYGYNVRGIVSSTSDPPLGLGGKRGQEKGSCAVLERASSTFPNQRGLCVDGLYSPVFPPRPPRRPSSSNTPIPISNLEHEFDDEGQGRDFLPHPTTHH